MHARIRQNRRLKVKNQNDIIISSVGIVLALIFLAVFYFTKTDPSQPSPPEQVITTPPAFQPGAVVMSDKLPGSDNQQQGQGGAPSGRSIPGPPGGGR